MEKIVICLRRRPDVTPEAFRDHWRNVHAPLVAKHAPTLGIRRYVQTYSVDAPPANGRPAGFDGIGELWVDSVAAFRAAAATPAGVVAMREIGESDALLTDLSQSPRTAGTEVVIVG